MSDPGHCRNPFEKDERTGSLPAFQLQIISPF